MQRGRVQGIMTLELDLRLEASLQAILCPVDGDGPAYLYRTLNVTQC